MIDLFIFAELFCAMAAASAAGSAAASVAAAFPEGEGGKKRELTRDTSVLREFHASESRDVLVLYHHVRDRAFDAFNSAEYHEQMLRYYTGGFSVVLVAPRTIEGADYFLVCLQHKEALRNMLCELSFLCQRQFAGASMLVKRRCFACGKPTPKRCQACHCASYCSKECQKGGWAQHKKLCKLVRASTPTVTIDPEVVALEL